MDDMHKHKVKIMRLKTAAWWIDYVALVANIPSWLKEQQAILNHVDRIDTLLQSAFNYLDVNDQASINQINEDSAAEHRKAIERLSDEKNPHNQFKAQTVGTQAGEQTIYVDNMSRKCAQNDPYAMEQHLLKTLKGETSDHHPV
jgi:hypothetical protein